MQLYGTTTTEILKSIEWCNTNLDNKGMSHNMHGRDRLEDNNTILDSVNLESVNTIAKEDNGGEILNANKMLLHEEEKGIQEEGGTCVIARTEQVGEQWLGHMESLFFFIRHNATVSRKLKKNTRRV